jgi:hypothetical protein
MSFRYSFRPVRIDAGGFITMPALDTSTGVMMLGGDVEGFFRSEDYGDHWRAVNKGLYSKSLIQCACIAWSVTEADTVYACVGDASSGGGGFLASTDGGYSWTVRSVAVQFAGNHAANPLPSGGQPRSNGNLLAQGGGYIYTATYSGGVYRSNDNGSTWTNIGLNGGNYYGRSIAMDPGNTDVLYVATYDWDGSGTYGRVWKTSNASSALPTWTQLTNAPVIVEELKILSNGNIYGACNASGVYRSTDGGSTWTSLNDGGTYIDTTTSIWQAIDGYVSGANDVVIVGCANPVLSGSNTGYTNLVQLSVDSGGGVAYAYLTADTSKIPVNSIPPEGRTWWLYDPTSSYKDWLGGNQFATGYILIEPTNTNNVYVTGSQGLYRSSDGGATWEHAINGMSLYGVRGMAVDSNDASRVAFTSSDYNNFIITDGIAYDASTVTNGAPTGYSGTEGYTIAMDPVDSTTYLSLGIKYTNSGGDVFHVASGSTSWNDDSLNLAGISSSVLASDSFARNVSNDTTTGWGTADTGGSWTIVSNPDGLSSSFYVSDPPSSGYIQLPANSGGYALFQEGISTQDSIGQVDISWDTTAAGATHFAQILVQSTDNTTNYGYFFRVEQATDGTIQARIQCRNGSADSVHQLGSPVTITASTGDTITLKYQVQGTNVYLKAWTGGAGAEPASWTISATDSSNLGPQAAGSIGMRADGSAGYTAGALFQFSNYSVSTSTTAAYAPQGEVAIGLGAGRDGSNNPYVLAAVWNNGMWRLSGGAWTYVDNTIASSSSSGSATEYLPIAMLSGSAYVYAFDRSTGVFRSGDYGQTWAQIWSITSNSSNTGYVVQNPAVANEVWVSTSGGLYKLSGADSGTVGSGITSTTIPSVSSPGPVAITADGIVYCVTLPSAGTPVQLLRSEDGGATWESVGDASLEGLSIRPNQIAVATNGRIYIADLGGGLLVGYNIGQSQNVG